MITIILILLVTWSIYSLFPTIYYKYCRRPSREGGRLKFTFDDGPHPEFTEKVRYILDEEKEKAIFFVVGEKAKRYPEVLQNLKESEHVVGLHCYHHSHPITWGPIKTYRDMSWAKDTLEKLGINPKYYRPPHGWVNLSMLYWVAKWNMKLVLWRFIPGDWNEGMGSDVLFEKIKAASKEGGIICLHDANHALGSLSRAPEHTIEALKMYFESR